ncbi:hypothetical protein DOTSEDRAFT_76625 [Dothistroma septosporum NZE10]|uniref:DNA polymerase lambda n=1 Tax=Dothistroma septosporum (strain NZE10 / CBS 128990) TaxID=675120 RepID=N1Q3N0_DOTSN|nr:hypothetical protein DOTSEDRAFT_76625 [Dothistroma septosporum NZE10]
MSQEERLQRKRQMYAELDSLQAGDESPDTGLQASKSKWKVSKNEQRNMAERASPARPLARSLSDSTVSARTLKQTVPDAQAAPSSTHPRSRVRDRLVAPAMLRKAVSDLPRSTNTSRLNGKRKRESFILQVPEDQRIFKDLHFYFFPNNDVHPARRMRIAKAVEHGAMWEKDWSTAITHVILDKSMDLNQVHMFLRLKKLPDRVVVVPEHYTAECLSYKTLLDPLQSRFLVKGHDPAFSRKADSTESDISLQLKPANKAAQAWQVETPPVTRPVEAAGTAPPQDTDDATEELDRVPKTPQVLADNEFDEAVRKARKLQHIPLDDDDDDDDDDDELSHVPATSGAAQSDNEEQKFGLKLLPKRKSKYQRMQDKFQCMQKHAADDQSSTANTATITILQQMADYYGQTGDEWRIRAYRKAMSSLRNHPTRVTSKEEALALPNVGERLATKIEEIAFTNRLRRLDNAKAEPNDQVLQTFMGVYGAGLVQASRWVSAGYTTLDEVLQKASLTQNQRIGIEHYADFNSRIPRAEVARHGSVVRGALKKIDSAFEVIVGGSYRRGSKDSGDIDCIITRPGTNADHLRNVVFGQVVPQLTASGFLVASLAITSRDDGSKWHGASCLPDSSAWRRLDLLLVPSDELGAALIYFTGNDIFNRSLRLLASTKGMRLNQHGLFRDVIRAPKRVKLTDGSVREEIHTSLKRDQTYICEHELEEADHIKPPFVTRIPQPFSPTTTTHHHRPPQSTTISPATIMSREQYTPPSLTQGGNNNAGGSNSGGGFAISGNSYEDTGKPVQYLCGDCDTKVALKKGDPIRCKECGYRVLYKERTNR